MKQIKVGFWYSESTPDFPKFPGAKVVTKMHHHFVERMYIVQSEFANSKFTKGSSTCRVCECENGSVEFYRENFVWPSGLAHYIKEHGYKPPEDFIKMINKNYKKAKR